MVFSYVDGIVRVYDVFTESDDEKKIKFYDNLCKNEKNYNCFIDISSKKEEVSKGEVEALKQVLEALENSALIGIPKDGKIDLNDLVLRFEKQKWIRKYGELKSLFRNLRNNKNAYKLIVVLRNIKKRDLEKKLINTLSKLSPSALRKEVDARSEKKQIPKISEQLMRRIK